MKYKFNKNRFIYCLFMSCSTLIAFSLLYGWFMLGSYLSHESYSKFAAYIITTVIMCFVPTLFDKVE